MVITNVNQVVYQGDGVTTAFPFTFRIIDATNIKLLLMDSDGTETDITSDYYVDTETKTVHYPGYAPGAEPALSDRPPVLAEGQKLVIYRELPITQEKNLGDKWPFPVIELALDKLTMILQQVFDWWGRTLKVSQGKDITSDVELTVPMVPGTVITVNADGTGFDAREALMEVNGAWDGEGRQIKGVAEPTDNQDAVTKNYVDTLTDNNFMKLQPDGTAWEGRNLPIGNVAGPALVKDAANKDYVDRILAGYSGHGDRFVFFDNVAQMQAAELIPSQMAVTFGYHDVNDGGAGVYTIRDKGADTPDGGSIIEIPGTDYVAELITDGTVNVKQFGSYGDGTHDDTAKIQTAIDVLSAKGGGNLFIPVGTYMIDQETAQGISVKSGVNIIGVKDRTILKGIAVAGTPSRAYVVSFSNVNNASIRNCVIDANKSADTPERQWHCIRIKGTSSNILIENNEIKNAMGDGIWIVKQAGDVGQPTHVNIRSNKFSNFTRQNISVVQGTYVSITENVCDGTIDIEANNSSDVNYGHIIANNHANTIAISVQNIAVDSNILVEGNLCDSAIRVNGTGNVNIVGNTVQGGVYIATSRNLLLTDNIVDFVYSNVTNGTYVYNLKIDNNIINSATASIGVRLKNLIDAKISNNKILMTAELSKGIAVENNDSPSDTSIVEISGNNITTDGYAIDISALSIDNTTHIIKGNTIKSVNNLAIYKHAGSSHGKLKLYDNDIYSNMSLQQSTEVELVGNRYYNLSTININYNSATYIHLKGERYYGAVPKVYINHQTLSGSVIIDDCAGVDVVIPTKTYQFYQMTASDLFINNVVASAIPLDALTFPIRTGSLIRYTGSSASYASWYNGASWTSLG